MSHPTVDDIARGRASPAHLAACAACRRLAMVAGVVAPAAAPELPPAIVADGHYVDWSVLAEGGGMGRVFRARDRRLDRWVAIKQLRDRSAPSPARAALVRRFEREARLTARLQHPSIVGVHEAGRFADGEPFYAMPLLHGAPLGDELARRTTLLERLALLPHLTAVAEAVAYAHQEGIVHRDLKPANILVGRFGETVVLDWGLAKDLRATEPEPVGADDGAADLTQLGVGTAHYMPPEQARGDEPDPQVDVYALGATLYHLLAGRPPYGDGDGATVRRKLASGPPPPLAALVPEVPPELADIVGHAMARDRAARYATAQELADELRRFQTGQLLRSRRYSLGELARHFGRRYRTPLRIAALAAIVLSATVVLGVRRIAGERDRARRSQAAAERELRRAEGVVASRLAQEPDRRLDAVLTAIRAVGPDLAAGAAPTPEAFQGLLDALTTGPIAVPLAHDGSLRWFKVSADHRRLIATDDGGWLRSWDARSGRPLAERRATVPVVDHFAMSADGERVAVCGDDDVAEVFDLPGDTQRTLTARSTIAGCGFLADGRLVVAADDVTVREPGTLAVLERLPLPSPASGFALGADGQLAVGSLDGTVRLWRPGAAPRTLTDGGAAAHLLAFTDPRTLWAVRGPALARWSLVDGGPAVERAAGADGQLVYLVPSADGARLAVDVYRVDERQQTIVVDSRGVERGRVPGISDEWAAATGWLLVRQRSRYALVDVDAGAVLTLPATRDEGVVAAADDALATADIGGPAYLWDLRTGAASGLLLGHTGELTVAALAPDGARVLTAGLDGRARLWQVADGAGGPTIADGAELLAAAWSADGHAVVLGDLAGDVRRVDAATGLVHARFHGPAPVAALAVARDRTVAGFLDGTLVVLDRDLAPVVTLPNQAGAVTAVAVLADGARLVSAHGDGSTWLWDVARAAPLAHRADDAPLENPIDHDGHASLYVTAGGDRVLAGRPAGATLVLDGADLADRGRLDGLVPSGGAPLAPDGRHVATIVPGGRVLVHDLVGAGPALALASRRGSLSLVAFTADGRRLVAGGLDGSLQVWDLATGAALATIAPDGLGPVTALALAPDGSAAFVGHASGALRLRPLTADGALTRACGVAERFDRVAEVAAYCAGRTASERTQRRDR